MIASMVLDSPIENGINDSVLMTCLPSEERNRFGSNTSGLCHTSGSLWTAHRLATISVSLGMKSPQILESSNALNFEIYSLRFNPG